MKPHRFLDHLDRLDPAAPFGHVRRIGAGVIEASGPAGSLGQLCTIAGANGDACHAQVVALAEDGVTLIPLDQALHVRLGARVSMMATDAAVAVGDAYAGRAIDALGRPIDGTGPILAEGSASLTGTILPPLDRVNPARVLETGIRAIDGLLTLGVGQRVGIFAASGVGKTTLVEQLAAQVTCDRCVLCLIGERGREVSALWDAARASARPGQITLVAATSDESPVLRARAADYAVALAEHWRARGEHVFLLLDSATRLAMALREIGLAAGAPPTVRAYTPNVFAALPRLIERCGATRGGGSITAILTVLSETDDVDDPIVEVMKSLLDGHIILSRTLAEQAHFPAIDIVRSVSRQASRLVGADHADAIRKAIALLAAYEESRVMIESGLYRAGASVRLDRAIAARQPLDDFLRQASGVTVDFAAAVAALRTALKAAGADD